MAKFSLNQLMSDKSKSESGKDAIAFKIELIPLNKLEPSKMNQYSVDDIRELKSSIELFGLQQNLTVRQCDGAEKYEIISGHRRFKALQELYATGNDSFSKAPCKIIKSTDDIQAELQLILANSTSRQLTDYEKTYQAARLKELLTELKKSGYKFTGRTREVVADFLKVSPAQVGRMESINNNLSRELTEEFKKENINITTAYELSKLGGEQQERALQAHRSGNSLTPDRVKKHKALLEQPKPNPEATTPAKSEPEEPRTHRPEAIPTEIAADHVIKIYPEPFNAIRSGLKTFEYRYDKGYKVGNVLRLEEYIPNTNQYTGAYIYVRVTYLLSNAHKLRKPVTERYKSAQ